MDYNNHNNYEDEDPQKAEIDELGDDLKRFESDGDEENTTFFGAIKEIAIKYRKFIVIFFFIAITWTVTNYVFYSIAHNSIYTAIKVYFYDGSSVINHYTNLEIQNDNYKKGEQLRLEGKYSDAIPHFETALSELKNKYSEDDLIIAQTRMHLGVSYMLVDNLADAYEQFGNAYVAYKNTLGDDNDNTNEARMYWAITNGLESDYEAAIRDATDAFNRIKYFGTRGECSYYLSEFFNKKGDYNRALECNDRYLGYLDSIVGFRLSNSVFLRKANGEILRGDIFYNATELENSDECYESALKDLENAEEAPGNEDLTLEINDLRFRSYQRLAEIKAWFGDDESAEDMFVKALECYGNAGGDDYDSLYLSSINAYKNSSSKLPQILLDNLDKTIAINGENNEYTVRQLRLLSEYYLGEQDYNNALAVNERSLDIQKNLLEEESPLSLNVYEALASSCLGLEEYEQAKKWALEGLRISTKIYGYKAQRTTQYIYQIIACMNKTKQYEKALTIIELCKTIDIPESESDSLPSWKDLEKRYIEKVDDKEKVSVCVKNAEELRGTITKGNYYSVIRSVILE